MNEKTEVTVTLSQRELSMAADTLEKLVFYHKNVEDCDLCVFRNAPDCLPQCSGYLDILDMVNRIRMMVDGWENIN